MMQRYDYEYIDMDEQYDGGPCRSIPIDDFRAELDRLVTTAEDKDGSDIRVTVDGSRDILVEFERPETDKERAAREERELRNKQALVERRMLQQDQKWSELRRLAAELGVTINE